MYRDKWLTLVRAGIARHFQKLVTHTHKLWKEKKKDKTRFGAPRALGELLISLCRQNLIYLQFTFFFLLWNWSHPYGDPKKRLFIYHMEMYILKKKKKKMKIRKNATTLNVTRLYNFPSIRVSSYIFGRNVCLGRVCNMGRCSLTSLKPFQSVK